MTVRSGLADTGLRSGAPANTEWRRGWPVVLASAGGVALSTTHIYSLGVLIAPIEAEFGWSRSQISSGLLIGSLMAVFSSTFVGALIDRVGPRWVALSGATLYCVALGLLANAGPSVWTWFGLWALLAIGISGITPTIWTYAVSCLFERSRGFALAATLCGTGLGSSLTPLLTHRLFVAYGWRGAYIGLAVGWAALILPLLIVLFRGFAPHRSAPGLHVAPILAGLTAAQGFRSARFYKLAAAAIAIALVAVSFAVNLVPILAANGLSREHAAEVAGFVGIASIVGRLSGGVLLDRLSGHLVAASCVLLPIPASILLLAMPGSLVAAIVATVLLGLSLGAELDAVAYLATRHLGMRSFGTLFGTISGLLSLATGLGPLVVSYAFDRTGSYSVALYGYIPLCLLAAALFASVGQPPGYTDQCEA